MSMTPIHRIPKGDSEQTLAMTVYGELGAKGMPVSLAEILEAMHSHTLDENHLSITLDWAMEIRNSLGISWSESIDAAMTLYFG